jgi:transcriptional regulator GlxA family with amidase domain
VQSVMDPRIKYLIGLIEERLVNELSDQVLSKMVNLSPGRLRQLFKQETGLSPKQYVKSLRMKRAEQLLRTSFLSIKEVTSKSGFRDVSHFVRDFKKANGMTPKAFRMRTKHSRESRESAHR